MSAICVNMTKEKRRLSKKWNNASEPFAGRAAFELLNVVGEDSLPKGVSMKSKNLWIVCILASALCFLSGCGGGDDNESTGSNAGTTGTSSKKDFTPEMGSVSVAGVVQFEGSAPARKKLNINKDVAGCMAEHGKTPPLSETVIVNDNKTLRNVVVYVSKGLAKYSFKKVKKTEPVVFDQVGCVYVPHVQAVMVGQPIHVKSSDDLAHNVHWKSKKNGDKNISQSKAGAIDKKTFVVRREEIGTAIFQCDIHGWMNAFVPVFKHPFFATTGKDGKFAFDMKLPAGKYTLTAWHEKFGKKSVKVEVKDGEAKSVVFTYSAKP